MAVVVLSSFIAILNGYQTGFSQINRLLDQRLHYLAQMLVRMNAPQLAALTRLQNSDLAVQVFTPQHQLLFRTQHTPQTPLVAFQTGFHYRNFNASRWRCFAAKTAQGRWVMVAERLKDRYQVADSIVRRTLLPIILSIPLIGLFIWWLTGRGLSPLSRLAAELRNRPPEDFSPLKQSQPPIELVDLHQAINRMLERIDTSLERERRFTNDAAHELRTPITALHINLFNLKTSLDETPESLTQLEAGLNNLSHLIEQMLALYRASPEQFKSRCTPLDLHELTRDELAKGYFHIERKHQEIELSGNANWLQGDPFALRLLVKNLVDNANKYTPDGGRIRVSVMSQDNQVRLTVEDSGPGIAPTNRDQVLQHFFRLSDISHDTQGSGLGLTIVAHIVELHQGAMTLADSPLGGLAIHIDLPEKST